MHSVVALLKFENSLVTLARFLFLLCVTRCLLPPGLGNVHVGRKACGWGAVVVTVCYEFCSQQPRIARLHPTTAVLPTTNRQSSQLTSRKPSSKKC
ncbi:hypothetical protein IWZ00DRAFT_509499 [Phyllosticta capitalensis]